MRSTAKWALSRAGWCRLLSFILFTVRLTGRADPGVTVYPSGPTVPENLLHLEIRTSVSWVPALKISDVSLVGADGQLIPTPFLDELLPGKDVASVVLLMHPGRVKTGVGANLALGRALHAGDRVTLMIRHPALPGPFRKTWQITPLDKLPPQPGQWRIICPPAGSRLALLVHLDKSLNIAAEDLIAVRGPDQNRIKGRGRLEDGECVWRFIPQEPWSAGTHAIVVHPTLEDVAGNRPGQPFEWREISGKSPAPPLNIPELRFEITRAQ